MLRSFSGLDSGVSIREFLSDSVLFVTVFCHKPPPPITGSLVLVSQCGRYSSVCPQDLSVCLSGGLASEMLAGGC